MTITSSTASSPGFTLIEVVAALVIFSLGVLMVAGLMTTLNQELERAALMSELVVVSQESLDSVSVLDKSELSEGFSATPLTVRGRSYDHIVAVYAFSPLVFQVDITVAPSGYAPGPSHSLSTYVAGSW